MRSYRQYCGLARSLDVVGDRWNLLIVRQLLVAPARHRDLIDGLPGIATNLLADRLRDLEASGVVERRLAGEGSVVEYALTPWGAGLREPMEALGRWGAPLMTTGRDGDSFRPQWLVPALPALLRDVSATPALELGLEVDDLLITLYIDENGPRAVIRSDPRPGTILTAAPEIVTGLAAGALTIDEAIAASRLEGDREILQRAFPPGRTPGTRS